jgi:hypothetical protein
VVGPIKLFIHHGYDLVESGPAENAGKHRGRTLLRLRFIPFHYATPTADDVVIAKRDPEFNDHWAFECPRRGGMPVSQLHEHGGRYSMIVSFTRGGEHVTGPWFPGREDILSSMALQATDERPGRVYFAAPKRVRPPEIMAALTESHPGYGFEQIHPRPRTRR